MKTTVRSVETSFREKGSKFIGLLFPSASVKAFEKELQKVKSQYADATHHCYAWRLHPHHLEEYAQDDGEPSGTAGLPILNKLKSFDAVNCGCIVIRYYGGTKLGKSGLIEAYGRATYLCLKKASLVAIIPTEKVEINYPYQLQNEIEQLKNSFDLKELEAEYAEHITLTLACRQEQADDFISRLQSLTHKGISINPRGSGFVTM